MATVDVDIIQIGWDVYSSDGEDIGDVKEVAPGYIRVHRGGLFKGDLYVPVSAVHNVEERGVWLNVAKGDIGAQSWGDPPGGSPA